MVQSATYDADDRNTAYAYDADGNVLDDGTNHYWYDEANELVGSAATGATSPTTTYSYNGDGIRVQQASSSSTTNYVIDSSLPYASVAEDHDGSNGLAARYVYGDDLVRMDRTSGEYYYIYDGLGSTRQLVNASGTVTDTYSYDAFGNLTSSPQLTPNPFLFNGQDMDGATGLIYLRARYMNPEDGRFLSQDLYAGRSADPISLHRYLYASDDPTVMEDPGGQDDGDIGSTMEACTESASLDGTGASATDAAEDAADDSISSSSSEETTSEEVESSDDPDESEEDEENNDGNIILFRGSSVGYPGNPSLQRMGMTPTSVDPVVSTLFATYSNQFEGTGIVMIIGSKDVGEAVIPNFDSTWPAEREMIVPLPPPAFEALVLLKGKIIPVGEAREILAGMGIGLPLSIINQTDLGNYISDHKFTTAEQAEQFAEEAGYEK